MKQSKVRIMRTEEGKPTAERLRHAGGDFEVADGRGATGAHRMRDCPLERALKHEQIDEREYQAAVKFRHHWWHAGMAGQIGSIDFDRIFSRDLSMITFMPKTEQQAFHRQKFREAWDELGKRPAMVVLEAICNELDLEHIGYQLGHKNAPQARVAAMTLLQDGLYRLAKLWGI